MKKSIAMHGERIFRCFWLPQFGRCFWAAPVWKREMIDDKASAAARSPRISTDVDGSGVWRVLARLRAGSELGYLLATAADAAPGQEPSYA